MKKKPKNPRHSCFWSMAGIMVSGPTYLYGQRLFVTQLTLSPVITISIFSYYWYCMPSRCWGSTSRLATPVSHQKILCRNYPNFEEMMGKNVINSRRIVDTFGVLTILRPGSLPDGRDCRFILFQTGLV